MHFQFSLAQLGCGGWLRPKENDKRMQLVATHPLANRTARPRLASLHVARRSMDVATAHVAGFRAGFRPDSNRAGRKADFEAFPIGIRPKSGPKDIDSARKH